MEAAAASGLSAPRLSKKRRLHLCGVALEQCVPLPLPRARTWEIFLAHQWTLFSFFEKNNGFEGGLSGAGVPCWQCAGCEALTHLRTLEGWRLNHGNAWKGEWRCCSLVSLLFLVVAVLIANAYILICTITLVRRLRQWLLSGMGGNLRPHQVGDSLNEQITMKCSLLWERDTQMLVSNMAWETNHTALRVSIILELTEKIGPCEHQALPFPADSALWPHNTQQTELQHVTGGVEVFPKP